MVEPSHHSHITELRVYPGKATDIFDSTTFSYSLQLPLWADILVIEPVPAEFATVEMSVQYHETRGEAGEVRFDADTGRGRYSGSLNVTGEPMSIRILVTAQDLSQSEYELTVGQASSTSCTEQTFCEEHLARGDCGSICADESIFVNWQTLAIIGGICIGALLFTTDICVCDTLWRQLCV